MEPLKSEIEERLQHAAPSSEKMESDSGWLPASQAIYDTLLRKQETGELKMFRNSYEVHNRLALRGRMHFPAGAVENKSKMFKYALFYNEEAKKMVGLCQFGPYSQGPIGCAHGGAIATVVDMTTSAWCELTLIKPFMTGNLTINYKRPIPLNHPVLMEIWLEKSEDRKHWVNYKMLSADGDKVYSEGVALWIQLKSFL